MKWFVRFVAGLIALGCIYASLNLAQVWIVGRSDQSRQVDAVVVLGVAQYDGRPSPQLQARLDHVLTLWEKGLTALVITTGGNQPGDRFTEAQASANYLIEGGIPEQSITQENTGTTTRESMFGVLEIMQSRGLRSILIVTDPYHALRSRLVAQDLGLESYVSPTRTSPLVGTSAVSRHVREALGVAAARVIGYTNLERLTK